MNDHRLIYRTAPSALSKRSLGGGEKRDAPSVHRVFHHNPNQTSWMSLFSIYTLSLCHKELSFTASFDKPKTKFAFAHSVIRKVMNYQH
jgi:hypothetical protein